MSQLSTKTEGRDLKTLLNAENQRRQFAAALPKHLTPDRFVRVATTALMRVHNLAQCTPESFMKCLLDLSAWGIEPDGRRAHLIPFKRRSKNKQTGQWEEVLECTLILDWKGLAELALRSGMIAKIHADLVCENDEFAYDMGEILHHRINFRQPRGEAYAAYAMAETKDGAKFVQVMTKAEIEGIRDNSQGWKAFKEGYAKQSPWNDSPGEMWKKTAFRRLAKWLPLSAEFRDAVNVEDEEPEPMPMRNVGPIPGKPDLGLPAIPDAPTEESSASVSPSEAVGSDEESGAEQSEPVVNDDADRETMLADLKARQDRDGVSDKQVKDFCVAQKLIPSASVLKKDFGVECLQALDERWTELLN